MEYKKTKYIKFKKYLHIRYINEIKGTVYYTDLDYNDGLLLGNLNKPIWIPPYNLSHNPCEFPAQAVYTL